MGGGIDILKEGACTDGLVYFSMAGRCTGGNYAIEIPICISACIYRSPFRACIYLSIHLFKHHPRHQFLHLLVRAPGSTHKWHCFVRC